MLKQKYKYSKKYIIKRVQSHKKLYFFLKENKLYTKYIEVCHKCYNDAYNINRNDFYEKPEIAFAWGKSFHILPGLDFLKKYENYKKKINEEI